MDFARKSKMQHIPWQHITKTTRRTRSSLRPLSFTLGKNITWKSQAWSQVSVTWPHLDLVRKETSFLPVRNGVVFLAMMSNGSKDSLNFLHFSASELASVHSVASDHVVTSDVSSSDVVVSILPLGHHRVYFCLAFAIWLRHICSISRCRCISSGLPVTVTHLKASMQHSNFSVSYYILY